jgi:hypothetical protein
MCGLEQHLGSGFGDTVHTVGTGPIAVDHGPHARWIVAFTDDLQRFGVEALFDDASLQRHGQAQMMSVHKLVSTVL